MVYYTRTIAVPGPILFLKIDNQRKASCLQTLGFNLRKFRLHVVNVIECLQEYDSASPQSGSRVRSAWNLYLLLGEPFVCAQIWPSVASRESCGGLSSEAQWHFSQISSKGRKARRHSCDRHHDQVQQLEWLLEASKLWSLLFTGSRAEIWQYGILSQKNPISSRTVFKACLPVMSSELIVAAAQSADPAWAFFWLHWPVCMWADLHWASDKYSVQHHACLFM